MYAITHLIYSQGDADVRTSAMWDHALHLERGISPADRGANRCVLVEGDAGGVLQVGGRKAREGCSEEAIRGCQNNLGCRRCGGEVKPGIAIEQTFSGSPDFPGGEVVTMSPGGLGILIDCMKCSKCGWSPKA